MLDLYVMYSQFDFKVKFLDFKTKLFSPVKTLLHNLVNLILKKVLNKYFLMLNLQKLFCLMFFLEKSYKIIRFEGLL